MKYTVKLIVCSTAISTSGNIHGNSQPHGTLMEPYVFLQAALWEGIPLTISVPQPTGPTRYEGKCRKSFRLSNYLPESLVYTQTTEP